LQGIHDDARNISKQFLPRGVTGRIEVASKEGPPQLVICAVAIGYTQSLRNVNKSDQDPYKSTSLTGCTHVKSSPHLCLPRCPFKVALEIFPHRFGLDRGVVRRSLAVAVALSAQLVHPHSCAQVASKGGDLGGERIRVGRRERVRICVRIVRVPAAVLVLHLGIRRSSRWTRRVRLGRRRCFVGGRARFADATARLVVTGGCRFCSDPFVAREALARNDVRDRDGRDLRRQPEPEPSRTRVDDDCPVESVLCRLRTMVVC
jgi:hypothetical protein